MPLKFSTFQTPISPGPEHDTRIIGNVIDAAKKLDAGGFGAFYLAEHHFTGYSTYGNNFMLGSYLAAATEQIHVGFLVSVVPLHHPFRLAEQANLLDQLTQGRFVFGVGSGGIPFEGLGFGQEPDGEHPARMNELMEIVSRAWAHTPEDAPLEFKTDRYEGTLYERIMPAAYTPGGPVIKRACQSEGGIRYAAQQGWAAHIFPAFVGGNPWDNTVKWWDMYRQVLDDAGHDDATIERCLSWTSAQTVVNIAESRAAAMATMSGPVGPDYMEWVNKQLALEQRFLGRNPVAERLNRGVGSGEGDGSEALADAGHDGPDDSGGERPGPPPFDPDGEVPKGSCMGTPEQVAAGLRDYEALGIQELLLGMDVGIDTKGTRDPGETTMADRFIAEVMPLL